jgi:hypothetical protein
MQLARGLVAQNHGEYMNEALQANWDQILAGMNQDIDVHIGTLKVADTVFSDELRADAHMLAILQAAGKTDEYYLPRLAVAAIKRLATK